MAGRAERLGSLKLSPGGHREELQVFASVSSASSVVKSF